MNGQTGQLKEKQSQENKKYMKCLSKKFGS